MALSNSAPSLDTCLESDRLELRAYQAEFAQHLYEGARESVQEVYPYLPWCHPNYQLSDAESWIALCQSDWQSSKNYNFAIYSKEDAGFIGGCGLNRIDGHPVMNLGYWIRSSAVTKGFASEAAGRLVEFGFSHLGMARIEILMAQDNPASQKVAINLGAQLEGVAQNRLLLHGKLHNAYVYALTPPPIAGLSGT